MLNNIFRTKKVEQETSPIRLSLEEKRFYIALYDLLPTGYSLSFHSDIINLTPLMTQNNNTERKIFFEEFKNQVVDFIVLDYQLKTCAVVLFDDPKDSKYNSKLHNYLLELGVPVFVYGKKDIYSCRQLINFLSK